MRTEVLPGNIGYIKFNGFAGTPDARPTAAAAMAFVAHTDETVRHEVANTLLVLPSTIAVPALAEVLQATDGKEGITALESHPDIDIIVSDINMPNMDGVVMTQKIRAHAYFGQIPIIALTSENKKDQLSRISEAGFDSLMKKPFNPCDLVSTVQNLSEVSYVEN